MNRLFLLIFLLLPSALALSQDEVLPPEEVFRYELSADSNSITVQWDVLPGHYLYKKRFSFSTPTPGVILEDPVYPQGELHEDEFFGEMEIFRGRFDVVVPVTATAAVSDMQLDMGLQGCADFGLCYPPQTWSGDITLAAAEATAGPAGGPDLRDILASANTQLGGTGEFLHPDEAFTFTTSFDDANTLHVYWTIAEGYYLYKDKIGFASSADRIQFGKAQLPKGKAKTDEFFGETEVYYTQVDAVVPFGRAGPESEEIPVQLRYQGCAEDGICYPPITKDISLKLPAASADDVARTPDAAQPRSEQDRLAGLIRDGNIWLVMGTFFGLGLLLAFTPCVLPMVPILSGIIAGQGKDITTTRAFTLSLTYVLGMALTYTIAGAAFAAAGEQAQAIFQKPWIIVAFSGLFVALAMSMFGAYELQMPSFIQSKVSDVSNQQRAGTFVGTAVMGSLSALVVTACVAPPLVAALAVIGQAGDVYRGGLALFLMSLGMGAPLLVVGASAGKLLPKAGPWMNTVKALFGVMLLGVAVWLVSRIVPAWATMLMWAIVAFVAAYVLGLFKPSGHSMLSRTAGAAAVVYGLALIVGTATGGTDPLHPFQGLSGHETTHLEFERIKSVSDLEARVAGASQAGRPVMLDFYADWCVSCKEMEKYTFTDASVQQALGNTVLLQADVTLNDEQDKALLQHFGIFGPPTIAFFGPDGKELEPFRVVGYVPAPDFTEHVSRVVQETGG